MLSLSRSVRRPDPRRLQVLLLIGAVLLSFTGCGQKGKDRSIESAGETLQILIWEDFIPPEVLADFERQTGITVKADYFVQPDILIERIRRDPARYDVITPPDFVVRQMTEQKLLAPLHQLSADLRPRLHERALELWFDPKMEHTLPLQFSVSAFAYNKKFITKPPSSWADFFSPAKAQAWSGRMTLLDDARETFGAALLSLRMDPNADDPAKLKAAGDVVRGITPFIAKFDSEKFEDALVGETTWLAHGWNGDLARAQHRNPDIVYVLPEEGALLTVDNLAIPAGARHRAAAENFIRHILSPATARRITQTQGFSSCVKYDLGAGSSADDLPLETVFGLPDPDRTFVLKGLDVQQTANQKASWQPVRAF